MPFPIESMLLFYEDESGNAYFDHESSLKLYYPNIYEIVTTRDTAFRVFIFYKEDMNTNYQYKNELALYYKYSYAVLEKYKNGSIPDIIKNYQPQEFVYGTKDYEKNFYGVKKEMEYKNTRFKEWIKNNGDLVTPYLTRQILLNKRFFIHVNRLDLSKRLRYNNYQEAEYVNEKEVFDVPRYLFVVSGVYTTDYMNLRFFIDGRFFAPDKMCKDDRYQYFYVPTTYINENSIIEIERFYNYEFHDKVTFTQNMLVKDVEILSDTLNIYANDI